MYRNLFYIQNNTYIINNMCIHQQNKRKKTIEWTIEREKNQKKENKIKGIEGNWHILRGKSPNGVIL